jgi:hypothetical protein
MGAARTFGRLSDTVSELEREAAQRDHSTIDERDTLQGEQTWPR